MYIEKLEEKKFQEEYGRILYLNGRVSDITNKIINADDAAKLQEAGLALKGFYDSGEYRENMTAYDNMRVRWVNKLSSMKKNALNRANTLSERVSEIESEPPIDLPTEEQQKKAVLLEKQTELQFNGNEVHDKTVIDNLMKSIQSGNIVSALAAAQIYRTHTELFRSGHRAEIYENMKTEAQKAQERLNQAELKALREQMVECQKTLFRCRNMEKQIAEKL